MHAKQAYNRILGQEFGRLRKKSKDVLAKKAIKLKRRKFVSKSQRIANKHKIFGATTAPKKK